MLEWKQHHQYDDRKLMLTLDGKVVAMMMQRVDGSWFAYLEKHWPIIAPLLKKDCTDLESGKRGCEVWAKRHCERLRAEIAGGHAKWMRDPQAD